MSTTLSHRGYTGTAEVSLEDGCLIGRVLHIRDIIAYEGESIAELETAFQSAVDDYLAFCEEAGKSPDKPYSGTFNVRVGEELHKKLAGAALINNVSLNEYVVRVCHEHFDRRKEKPHIVIRLDTEAFRTVSTRVSTSDGPRVIALPEKQTYEYVSQAKH